jgi:hypothetical protein
MTAFRAAPLPPFGTSTQQQQQPQNQTTVIPNLIEQQALFEDLNDPVKLIDKLVEQIGLLNVERLKRITENKQNLIHQTTAAATTNGSNDMETITESIRAQSEQNQILRRLFSQLEKELRSLTETRLELEIKLDYLNTAASAAASSTTTTTVCNTPTTTNPISTPASNTNSINVTKKIPLSKSNNISNATPILMTTSSTTPQMSSSNNQQQQQQQNHILTTPVIPISSNSKI